MFSPTALGALLQSPMVLDPYYGPVTCQLILLALDEWERGHPGMLDPADAGDLAIVRDALKLHASIAPGTLRPATPAMLSQSSSLPHHAISQVFRNGATTGTRITREPGEREPNGSARRGLAAPASPTLRTRPF